MIAAQQRQILDRDGHLWWGLLARKVYSEAMQFRTREQFKTAILKSWEEITIDQLQNLVNSVPERIF